MSKANLAMDRLRTLVARREADKTVSDAERQRLEEDARRAEARADAEAAEARKQRQDFDEKERGRKNAEEVKINGRKLAAYVTGGVAVAGLGTRAGLRHRRQRQPRGLPQGHHARRQAGAARPPPSATAAVSDVGLVVGLAAAVTTVIVFPKNVDEPTKRSRW